MHFTDRSKARARCVGATIIRAALIATNIVAFSTAHAQQPSGRLGSAAQLDSLIAQAVAVNPAIDAAEAQLSAARARISPAGTLPDPTLMAGIANLPISNPSFTADPMTMKMVGVAQVIPYPGKLGARRHTVELEADAAAVALDTVRLAVVRKVKTAYYELAYLDHALAIVKQNEQVLGELAGAAQSHYAVGAGGQQDVLKARVAATQLGETANMLIEQRQATLATLNAALNRPVDTPVDNPDFPSSLTHAAVAEGARNIRFVANTLGAPAADSPLPSLAELQALATERSPGIRVHEAMIAAQVARVELEQKEYKPDFDVSVQYGQRVGLPDMVTAQVSIPLRIHKRAVQDEQVAEARAELAALHAEHESQLNDIHATVARLYSEIERNRTQLALYVRAILPQGQASVASATASYQVGKVDLLTLLDSQTTLFSYQTAYYRALADFGATVAQLEQAVGQEIVK
ncbi:MAG TPA: TolC family protein [Gemmatimonadaceae bacterium]